MFPIRDHNPSGRRPYVTLALIALNAVIFLISGVGTGASDAQLGWLFYTFGLVPGDLTSGGAWWPIMTSMFLHGGWMHVIGNMWFLWIFGDNLEDGFGHVWFLAFYLVSGLAAALLQVMASPMSPIPMVGASGAIAGVMGGYLLLFPKAKVDVLFIFIVFFRIFAIPAWIVLGVWIGLQLWGGAMTPVDQGGVAWWAHVGGFAAGAVLVLPYLLRRGGKGYWQANEGHPPHPEAHYRLSASSIPKVPRP